MSIISKTSQVILKSRPIGIPKTSDFAIINQSLPKLSEGQILAETLYLSVDPYMRSRMNDGPSYIPAFLLDKPIEGGIIARVIQSRLQGLPEGTLISGMGPWADYNIHDGQGYSVIEPSSLPLSYHLGVLGMPGMTAYVGLKAIGNMKPGQNIFISAASGAVGQVAGQIARIMGCHVAGSVGSDDKMDYLKDHLGFNAVFNYKKTDNLVQAVKEANPAGIDIYFENVGGAMLEAALFNMRQSGRIALCGMIAHYNATNLDDQPIGPRNLSLLITRSLKMQGFIVSNYPQLCKEWISVGSSWLKAKNLIYKESITDGLEKAPEAFIGMLEGKNFGKAIVRVKSV